MKHGRAKAARKTLKFFRLNHGIQAPYKLLLDGNFLVAIVRHKVPIRDRISTTIQTSDTSEQHSLQFHVTRSTLKELEALKQQQSNTKKGVTDEDHENVFHAAWRMGLDECTIIEDDECVTSDAARKTMKKTLSKKDDRMESLDGAALSALYLLKGEPQPQPTPTSSNHNKTSPPPMPPPNPQRFLLATQDPHLSDNSAQPSSALYLLKGEPQPPPPTPTSSNTSNHKNTPPPPMPPPNPQRFLLATQDPHLSDILRTTVPMVPILKLSRGVMLLEIPSPASKRYAERSETQKLSCAAGNSTISQHERTIVKQIRKQTFEKEVEQKRKREVMEDRSSSGRLGQQQVRRSKKAKGPNPLSCKKKKVDGGGTSQTNTTGKKKRNRTHRKKT
eukprot:CAMPEP_0194394162 /NCGR_PEP_ID=MMETSP0174-20130528/123703_1 /TAXON_ID=216777 /ORGANISM="Proboscia alata, Strain PI-D3" /LENGTH=388 /DNA_ID=CAMNT_0039189933 /DNA_START=299 /DNA_END=1466 /DNA_ORIENTATION=+